MSSERTFMLDGRPVAFEEGDTIMDAALRAGEYIPHLCHHPGITPHGSCRICMVEVDGRQASACTLPAAEDARVVSNSDDLMAQRRTILQMLFVEGNHICPACEKSGDCQLQAVAYYTGLLALDLPHFFPRRSVDASHPDAVIDFNRCILCELCVRASRDVDRKNVFSIGGRGINSHLVIDSPTGKLGDSSFSATDRAAEVCPVGAILPKHQAYEQPIGKRPYDRQPVSGVGNAAVHQEKGGA